MQGSTDHLDAASYALGLAGQTNAKLNQQFGMGQQGMANSTNYDPFPWPSLRVQKLSVLTARQVAMGAGVGPAFEDDPDYRAAKDLIRETIDHYKED